MLNFVPEPTEGQARVCGICYGELSPCDCEDVAYYRSLTEESRALLFLPPSRAYPEGAWKSLEDTCLRFLEDKE